MTKSSLLTNYFLTQTAPIALDFYKSIMDLPKDEAEKLTAEFTTKSSSRGSYYDHRQDVEAWLRTQAQLAGVVIENRHPLYFRLTTHIEICPPESGWKSISLPAAGTDLSRCSFTLEDSFCNHEYVRTKGGDAFGVRPHPLLGKVFNSAQIEDAIHQHKLPDYLQRNDGSYIEVQMWARPP